MERDSSIISRHTPEGIATKTLRLAIAAGLAVKGRGQQQEAVTLSKPTVEALADWLQARRELDGNQPLLIALDRCSYDYRLMGTAIYQIVAATAEAAGIRKKLSPHRIVHLATHGQ
jgi:site-specific recombinase XerC